MGVAKSLKVLGAGIVWRRTDVASAEQALMRALAGDEQERTLAGMALVQAGTRSVPLLEAEFTNHGATKLMVRVLADIGGNEAHRVLEQIAAGNDDVAHLAREVVERGQPA